MTPFAKTSLLYKSVPNTLTGLRLLGAPLVVWLAAYDALGAAFWVFVAVCVTDGLDGWLARKLEAVTNLGRILDPLADKCLLVSVYTALALWDHIPAWLAVLVVGRDILILAIAAGIMFSRKDLRGRLTPHLMGKISTTLQMLFAGLLLGVGTPLSSIPASGLPGILMVSFLYGVALATVLSGLTYAWAAFSAFRKPRLPE